MVDWSLARQIARFASGGQDSSPVKDDLGGMAADAERHVAAYTGLTLASPAPAPEAVDRAAWADTNLTTLSGLLDPVTDRLSGRLDKAGPLAGALRMVAGATLAAEAGLVIGYMAQRVLGQYEVSLLQPEQPPRLLFVAPNLEKAIRELGVDRDSFLQWIVLHEVTHVFEFGGVPWLREHMSALLHEYVRTLEVRIENGHAGGIPSLPDPATLVERFKEGGLAALIQSPEQRELMDRIQAAMAVIEGYSEHVMDAVGAEVLPAHEGLREAMERRRASKSAPQRILERLLGLDMKLRQYELGRTFSDAVAEKHGIEGLNRVWDSPQMLPTLAELEDPKTWFERVERAELPAS
jgi:coenzyme F420 biosynthesis associated uncharacterized protein